MRSFQLCIFIIIAIMSFPSCRVSLNKKNEVGQRHGKWITEPSTEQKEIGWYKNGIPYRTWRYYSDGLLERKENYRGDNKSKITLYQQNGKKYAQGSSKFEIGKEMHWFYFGKWKYYNKNGKLNYIRYFENGEEVSEKKIK